MYARAVLLVVVAGAEVAVAPDAITLPSHHHQHLRVGLVAHHAVNHVYPGFLQPVGERDVRFLVEACTQLDDGGDILAIVRSGHQCIDEGRVRAGAIQGLLDGQYLRIRRRLSREVGHRCEAVEGVLQQLSRVRSSSNWSAASADGGSAGAKGGYLRSLRSTSS